MKKQNYFVWAIAIVATICLVALIHWTFLQSNNKKNEARKNMNLKIRKQQKADSIKRIVNSVYLSFPEEPAKLMINCLNADPAYIGKKIYKAYIPKGTTLTCKVSGKEYSITTQSDSKLLKVGNDYFTENGQVELKAGYFKETYLGQFGSYPDAMLIRAWMQTILNYPLTLRLIKDHGEPIWDLNFLYAHATVNDSVYFVKRYKPWGYLELANRNVCIPLLVDNSGKLYCKETRKENQLAKGQPFNQSNVSPKLFLKEKCCTTVK